MSVFSNFFALILSRNYLWLVVFSLFNCGDISAVRVKIRLRRPSVSRRCADEKTVKFPCRTPKYPADGNRGTCRGIFVWEKGQGLRGESLSQNGKFSCCGTQNRRSLASLAADFDHGHSFGSLSLPPAAVASFPHSRDFSAKPY